MQLKRRAIALIVAVCLLALGMAPAALGQQAAIGDWSVVQSLTPDEQIVISLTSGKEDKGKFLCVKREGGGGFCTTVKCCLGWRVWSTFGFGLAE